MDRGERRLRRRDPWGSRAVGGGAGVRYSPTTRYFLASPIPTPPTPPLQGLSIGHIFFETSPLVNLGRSRDLVRLHQDSFGDRSP